MLLPSTPLRTTTNTPHELDRYMNWEAFERHLLPEERLTLARYRLILLEQRPELLLLYSRRYAQEVQSTAMQTRLAQAGTDQEAAHLRFQMEMRSFPFDLEST